MSELESWELHLGGLPVGCWSDCDSQNAPRKCEVSKDDVQGSLCTIHGTLAKITGTGGIGLVF